MAATDAPATLAEMRTAFLNSLKEVTGVTAVNTVVDRYLNTALQDMHQEPWWWAERRSTIRTIPPYSTGTVDVAITNLTTRRTVTGTSTAWTTLNSFDDANAVAGYKMTLGSTGVVHVILTVGGATSITLDPTTPYAGDSALSNSGYAIYQDEYALPSDFNKPIDMRFFDDDRKIELIGPQELYRMYARNSVRQAPKYATLIELGPSGSVALRRRILFAPAPDKTYTIPYRYTTTNLAVSTAGALAANLSLDTDEPIVPIRFRQGIIWKALELWTGTRKGTQEYVPYYTKLYESVVARARAAHSVADDLPRLMPMRTHLNKVYRAPVTARRLTTGTAWDQLLE